MVKGNHKTHPVAYTIQKADEEPYTIVDTTCRKVYDTKYFGKYEVPQCVLNYTAKRGQAATCRSSLKIRKVSLNCAALNPMTSTLMKMRLCQQESIGKRPANGGMKMC